MTVGIALVVSGRSKYKVSENGLLSVFRWETSPESVSPLSLLPEDAGTASLRKTVALLA